MKLKENILINFTYSEKDTSQFTFFQNHTEHLLPKAEMTVPRVTSDLLILAPSFSRSPVSPVASALSLRNYNIYSMELLKMYCYTHHKMLMINC